MPVVRHRETPFQRSIVSGELQWLQLCVVVDLPLLDVDRGLSLSHAVCKVLPPVGFIQFPVWNATEKKEGPLGREGLLGEQRRDSRSHQSRASLLCQHGRCMSVVHRY